MKTAFYATDCSVDSALALRRWQTANPNESLRLTILHSYDLDDSLALNRETYRAAKQQAKARLDQWLEMLTQSWAGELNPETLLASPELAITMHLLLRSYDFLLLDEQVISETILHQTKVKVCRLTDHELCLLTI